MTAGGTAAGRLHRWEKVLLAAFLAGWLVFGVVVEIKSAFLSRRYGDLGVYLRAAWAIQAGVSPYDVTDSNGWHYHYPPLFAILLGPLADPPPDVAPSGAVPFAISVAICYFLSLLCLAVSVHALASALEAHATHPAIREQPAGCRRWWLLRTLPVLICLPPIGHTLMRGQTNLLLLMCVCLGIAAALRGRRLWSGIWLAGAACLKIYPAYLFLFPLWRRDLRGLTGCALGLIVGLLVIPCLRLGPARTIELYQQQFDVLIRPALGIGDDQSRAKELIEATATDSQSFVTMIHNTLHLDRPTRPHVASPAVRRGHWVLGVLFTVLTLAAVGRRPVSGPSVALFVGALALGMILTSPVCHTHYFVLLIPLIMGLLALSWEHHPGSEQRRISLLLLFGLQTAGQVLPLLPTSWGEVLKDTGFASYAALVLWLAACWVLRRSQNEPRLRNAIPIADAA
jgi:hypothetical protein